jgi:hypothetical protein
MWIENAFKFCGKLIHFYKERISFLFYCEDGKRGAVRLLSLNAVCGSQADLSFTWCLQVSVVPLTVRWFLEDFPLSFIFNTAGLCILHNEQCEKPRTKIFRRSYHVFPSPIEPRIRIRFRRIRSLCLQIILARLVILTIDIYTVVKELRSKMLGQHPGYFKAVFLKKTQIIIVSIYEYTVYIMFWIMMLHDCYYY